LCTFGPVIGPATSIAGEVSGTRLRAKSQAIGFAFNYFFSTVWNVVVPYMFNPDQGNLGGKIGWIYAATCLTAIVIVYFEFPETKNRTYIELDHMFDMRLSSRNFAGFVVPHSTTAP
jgi:MFS transporter, SP family, general alpha glucoside:H+ symporter